MRTLIFVFAAASLSGVSGCALGVLGFTAAQAAYVASTAPKALSLGNKAMNVPTTTGLPTVGQGKAYWSRKGANVQCALVIGSLDQGCSLLNSMDSDPIPGYLSAKGEKEIWKRCFPPMDGSSLQKELKEAQGLPACR